MRCAALRGALRAERQPVPTIVPAITFTRHATVVVAALRGAWRHSLVVQRSASGNDA